MDVLKIEAKPRKKIGGSSGRQLRAQHLIPVVVYGNKQDPENILVDGKEFERGLKMTRGENVMIDLAVEGGADKDRVFLRDLQRDPVSGKILHADFLRLDPTHQFVFEVPVHLVGDSVGVREGGILDQHLRHIEIRCLPKDLPSHVDGDVSNLEIHDSIHVSDLNIPEDLEVLNTPEDVIAGVLSPRKIEMPAAAEEGAEAAPGEEEEMEPEVIGEKKEEEEGKQE